MRRALAVAALLVVGGSVAASANPVPPVPVGVYQDRDGATCVVISEQVPKCVNVSQYLK